MTVLGVSLLVLGGTLTLIACRAWGRDRSQAEQRRRTTVEREDARLDRIERRRRLGLPDDDQRRQR